jgi:hypothetical protein
MRMHKIHGQPCQFLLRELFAGVAKYPPDTRSVAPKELSVSALAMRDAHSCRASTTSSRLFLGGGGCLSLTDAAKKWRLNAAGGGA